MHPVIWKDHDDSWTWSIEEGKAFEEDHQVLARDEGFATRGDAKESMQKAWDRLIAEGKTPGRPGLLKPPTPAPGDDTISEGANNKAPAFVDKKTQLEWAVITGQKIIAVFATQSQAKKYGHENHKGKYKLVRVKYTVTD